MKDLWTFIGGLNKDDIVQNLRDGQAVDILNGVLEDGVLSSESLHGFQYPMEKVYGAVTFMNIAWIFGKSSGKDTVLKIRPDLSVIQYFPVLNLERNLQIEVKEHKGKVKFYCTDGKSMPFVWEEGAAQSEPLFFYFSKPRIGDVVVLEGVGSISCGAYRFCARSYMRENFKTEWGPLSDFVTILRSEEEGGHEETFKAIRFTVEGLNPELEYLDVGVIRYDSTTLSPLFDVVATLFPSGNTKMTVLFDGRTLRPSTLDEFLFTGVKYSSAGTIKAKDNRLFLGNVSVSSYPDCKVIADNIRVKHEIVPVPFEFYKSYDSMSKRTYKSGEVYSFCFIPVYKDGTEGRAYPIPWKEGDTLEKYESMHVNATTGNRLTFHRIPKYPFLRADGLNIVKLNFEVEKAILDSGLSSHLSGYIIGRQNRDKAQNVSKIAQGFLSFGGRYVNKENVFIAYGPGFGPLHVTVYNTPPLYDNDTRDFFLSPFESADTVGSFFSPRSIGVGNEWYAPICGFHSPEFLMRSLSWKPSEAEKVYTTECKAELTLYRHDKQNVKMAAFDVFVDHKNTEPIWTDGKANLKNVFLKIEPSDLSGDLSFIYTFDNNPVYVHKHSEMSILDFGDPVPESVKEFFRSIPGYRRIPEIVFNPNWIPFPISVKFQDGSPLGYPEREYVFPYAYVSVVDLNSPNLYQYGTLETAEFFPVYVSKDFKDAVGVLNGDIYVTPFSIRHSGVFDYRRYNADTREKIQIPSVKYADFGAVINGMTRVFLESTVNGWWRMRYRDEETQSLLPSTVFHPLASKEKVFEVPVMVYKGNYYNSQYSAQLMDKPYFPNFGNLPLTEVFPHRVVYSEFQRMGSFEDAWRSFSPVSFQDLPSEGGKVVRLAVYDSIMISLNEYGCYRLYTSEKERAETSIIGTVPILGLPPEMLGSGQGAFGGCADPFSVVETPFGIFWYNRHGKKIHSYSYVTIGEGVVKLIVSDISDGLRTELRKDFSESVYAFMDQRRKRAVFSLIDKSYSYDMERKFWVSSHDYRPTTPCTGTEKNFFYGQNGILYGNFNGTGYFPFMLKVPFSKDFFVSKVFDSAETYVSVPFDEYQVTTENQVGESIRLVIFEEGKELESNCRFVNDHWQFKLILTENFEFDLNYRPKGKYLLLTLKKNNDLCRVYYVGCSYRWSLR